MFRVIRTLDGYSVELLRTTSRLVAEKFRAACMAYVAGPWHWHDKSEREPRCTITVENT